MIARSPVWRMGGRASVLAALGLLGTFGGGRRRDAVRERAVLDPRGGVADHEVALGVGQVLSSRPGDVTGPHGTVDPDL
jgi:hypothetical protein